MIPVAASCCCSERINSNGLRWLSKSSAGSGIAIRPLSLRFGNVATTFANAGRSSGLIPLLLASPLTLTCKQILSGGRSGGRCSDKRRAIFSRSTACAQAKCSAIGRVLLLCIGPMKCHSSADRGEASVLPAAYQAPLEDNFPQRQLGRRRRLRSRPRARKSLRPPEY